MKLPGPISRFLGLDTEKPKQQAAPAVPSIPPTRNNSTPSAERKPMYYVIVPQAQAGHAQVAQFDKLEDAERFAAEQAQTCTSSQPVLVSRVVAKSQVVNGVLAQAKFSNL